MSPRHLLPFLLAAASLASAATLVETRVEIGRDPLRRATVAIDPATGQEKKLAPLPSAEADKEFGQLVTIYRQASLQPWTYDVDVFGFFTDNAALAPREVEDFFMVSGVGATYNNRISGPWSFTASLRQDFIRYDEFQSLDFDLTKLRAGVGYKAAWLGNASFTLRYQFDHLSEPGFGSALLDSHSIFAALSKSWKIATGQRLYLGLMSEPNLIADPDIALRHEHALFGGWSLRLTDHLSARLTGRAGYHTGPNTGRNDWHYVAAANATYALTDWASIGATSSLTWNASNKSAYDYRSTLVGVYVGFELKF